MQMQNIQNVMQQYGMYAGNNKTQGSTPNANPFTSDSIKNSTSISAFSFTLDIQQFSVNEINNQGQNFQFFSLEELHISFSSSQLTTATELPKGLEYGPDNPGVGQKDYWGIDKTSERLADFVVNGSGDSLERLKQGREGILQGLKEAEKMWGGKLPEISYKTIEAALGRIDDRIHELGGSVINIAA